MKGLWMKIGNLDTSKKAIRITTSDGQTLKKCPKCDNYLSIDRFNKNKRTRDGLCCWCKICDAVSKKKWSLANPDKIRERSRRRAQSGYMKEYKHAYYLKNKDKIIQKVELFRHRNKIKNSNSILDDSKQKYCGKCYTTKKVSDFHRSFSMSDGCVPWCKICVAKYDKEYRQKNITKIRLQKKSYSIINKEKFKTYHKQWRQRNKEKVSSYAQKGRLRILSHPTQNLSCHMSHAIYMSLMANKNGKHWEGIVGYTTSQLKRHLQSQFTNGMTWQNYSKYGWHIDHIIPKSFFEYNSPDDVEFKMCWRLENLRPLWWRENLSKGCKLCV